MFGHNILLTEQHDLVPSLGRKPTCFNGATCRSVKLTTDFMQL